ncbi:hypothetical protein GH714_015765 [Hevea brasiliensis]|uniref:Anthocyanidin 3-O-glucosyltransferase n=1 Tax=Hevea brasiliensis TaxID=3981 RepID=A0A6A6L4Z0_HEVBR|nr:hypothetical protein GH714_015765 [Hevea brasiliensis]
MAKLFASRGLKVSIITTPVNAPVLCKSIERNTLMGHKIDILIIQFPCVEAGLPEVCEQLDLVTSPEMGINFFKATTMLVQPLEELLKEYRPNCLVADTFFPWSTGVASKLGIPRIVFSGTCFFSSCASQCMRLYQPYKKVSSETDPFIIPNFPGQIKLTRKQLPDFVKEETSFAEFYEQVKEAELKSFGVLVNSFYELEPTYADHFRKVLGAKAWHIGPIFLCNSNIEDKAKRGKEASIDENQCLKWLDSKQHNSVVYICFGSIAKFRASQLLEIAMALEDSGQQFIWVVRKNKNDVRDNEVWLPEGFEERIEGKGLIIRGWAPQVLILEHEAVEEQFYNEKLVTQVLGIGVAVGAQQWARVVDDSVKKEAIRKAVTHLMASEEAEEMRFRAKKLGEMARKAIEVGGSSHSDFNCLIEELRGEGM